MGRRLLALLTAGSLALAACASSGPGAGSGQPGGAGTARSAALVSTAPAEAASTTSAAGVQTASGVPQYSHIVVVIEENHAAGQIIGSAQAPYMNSLAGSGVELTNSFGIRHPSQPNYLALFSGSTHGITDDSCPHTFSSTNLGHQLRAAGKYFTGYSESLPSTGSEVCTSGSYARKHVPWTDFSDLPTSVNQRLAAFPTDFAKLPRVAFVIPNLDHDMHNGTVAQADSWLHSHLSAYVTWARTHNSLFVLTWDEDDNTPANHIPGVLVGAHLKTEHYSGRVDHYTMLRTLEAACGLTAIGAAAQRSPISGIWT